jgi:hypothetical protein
MSAVTRLFHASMMLMATIASVSVVGVAALGLFLRRRRRAAKAVEEMAPGRAVIAANLAATRHRVR